MSVIIFLVLLAAAIMAAVFVYSGAVLGIPGNGLRVLVMAALTVLAVWQCTTAMAHGDAAWIMANPRYVDRDGVHCCGPTGCRRLCLIQRDDRPTLSGREPHAAIAPLELQVTKLLRK